METQGKTFQPHNILKVTHSTTGMSRRPRTQGRHSRWHSTEQSLLPGAACRSTSTSRTGKTSPALLTRLPQTGSKVMCLQAPYTKSPAPARL